jgi:hypothetical protein
MPDPYTNEPSALEHNPSKARREALSAILLLLLLLLILLLIAAATERTDILRFAGAIIGPGSVLVFQPRLGAAAAADVAPQGAGSKAALPAQQVYEVDALFRTYYDDHGGADWFGQPVSPVVELGGRRAQWFERGRLEYSEGPDGASVQAARLGAEFTAGITFPTQQAFADRPGARYFPQTQHGVVDPFLSFWEQAGGLDTLGYPISEQVQETLPDGLIATVQYFERGRLEISDRAGPGGAGVRLGALGRAIYLDKALPRLIPPARPTPVPAP